MIPSPSLSIPSPHISGSKTVVTPLNSDVFRSVPGSVAIAVIRSETLNPDPLTFKINSNLFVDLINALPVPSSI